MDESAHVAVFAPPAASGHVYVVAAPSRGMSLDFDRFDHPAWLTAAGVGAGYGVILLVMFVALFLVPLAVFGIFISP